MNRLDKALRSERSVALLAAFLAAGLIVGARATGLLEPIELAVYDRLLAARPAPDDPGSRVIVVGYTEGDVQQQAVYPVPDETMAELLETILSYGPRGIGVDFLPRHPDPTGLGALRGAAARRSAPGHGLPEAGRGEGWGSATEGAGRLPADRPGGQMHDSDDIGWGALASGTWIPVAPPLGGWLLSAAGVTAYISRRESADRKVMMQLFSRHVSRTVARDIWEHRDQFLEGGRPRPQRQYVTVLFVDVKSFTPVAEGLEPLILMDWVNDLMGVLAQEVEDHGGFVDDYFGDGMKADFGVPVPRETDEEWRADAIAAVRCAIAMEEKLAHLNASWEERDMPTGRLRVGIDSGYAVVGNVGSSDRMKYTVLGDTANTAARLESLDDSAHDFERKRVRVLVSQRSRELLGDLFETFDHGEVSLKGKSVKIRTFEVLDSRHPAVRARRPAAAQQA